MRSDGSVSDENADDRTKFVEWFQRAKAEAPSGAPVYNITNTSKTIRLGNWDFSCIKYGNLLVTNRIKTQRKLNFNEADFTDDKPGFTVESTGHKVQHFTTDTPLGF